MISFVLLLRWFALHALNSLFEYIGTCCELCNYMGDGAIANSKLKLYVELCDSKQEQNLKL